MGANKHRKNHSNDSKKVKVDSIKNTSPKVNKNEMIETMVKHPLNDKWTLWYLKNDQTKSWEDQQNAIYSFNTVEDFWSIYNHILAPSEVSQGNDYSLFKNNIRPMWEDSANKHGGRWVINVHKQLRHTKLDELWLDTLLCLMGEYFKYCDHVNGAVVNIRHSGDKISIWTSDAKNKKSVLAIGVKLKEYLRLDSSTELCYEVHSLSKNAKQLYTL